MFTQWVENFRSKKTKETYRYGIQRFVAFKTDQSPRGIKRKEIDEFLEKYIEDLEGKEDYLTDIKSFLNDMNDNLTAKTLNTYITAVREYFREEHDLEIDESEWKKMKRRGLIPKGQTASRDKLLTKKELRRVVSHLDSFGRSIVLFMITSGARVGEAIQVRVDDLMLDEDPPRVRLDRRYTKNGRARTVFMTEEAKEEIEEWLEIRKGREKQTAPHLREKKKENRTYETDRVWNTLTGNVRKRWNRALKKAGLDDKDRKTGRRYYHLHTLRKYFRTRLSLEKEIVEMLLGHESELDRAYNRYTEQQLGEKYKEASKSLCVYKEWKEIQPNLSKEIDQDLKTYKTMENLIEQGVSKDKLKVLWDEINHPDIIEKIKEIE